MKRKQFAIWLLVLTTSFVTVEYGFSQDEDAPPQTKAVSLRLFEKPPFDRISLQAAAGGGTFDVRTLDFPDRKIPVNPPPGSRLKVHLVERDVEAEIYWRDIARVELFEQMVLAEAESLVAQKKFDAAYDYYDHLHTLYPGTQGLTESTHGYWYRNAGALFQQGEHVPALALLDHLHQQNAEYEGLAAALSSVTGRLMSGYLRDKNYAAARRLLELTARRSGDDDPHVTEWRQTLEKAAAAQLLTAREDFGAKRYRAAREAALNALDIWPRVTGARELLTRIDAAYPMVVVAVAQSDAIHAVSPALHPALFRRTQLTQRPLVRLSGYNVNGPQHESAWGEIKLAGDRKHVDFEMRRVGDAQMQLTGYDLAELMLAGTQGSDQTASMVREVELSDVYSARLHFVRGHVSPLSWLTRLAPSDEFDGEFVSAKDESGVRFTVRGPLVSEASPQEIIERQSHDPSGDIDHLMRGKIDVIARVDPAQLEQLRSEPTVTVQPFALPRVHVLIPNARRPLPGNRTFRRAVAYAIPREHILQSELLGGLSLSGCQVTSGICPASADADDFWSYGYDNSIAPLPYEPALAVTLYRVAQDEIALLSNSQDRDALPAKIVIGHEDDWLHAKAVQSIVDSLNRLGLSATRLTIADPEDHARCDFIYAELLSREPVVDVLDLLRSPHLPESGIVALQIRQLANVTNWREATDRLHEIHSTLHAEQTVIPLWQIQTHCAFSKRVTGFTNKPISLYDDVRAWRITAGSAVAERDGN